MVARIERDKPVYNSEHSSATQLWISLCPLCHASAAPWTFLPQQHIWFLCQDLWQKRNMLLDNNQSLMITKIRNWLDRFTRCQLLQSLAIFNRRRVDSSTKTFI